jgi:hypothetical protein
MKTKDARLSRWPLPAVVLFLAAVLTVQAFPPSPPHVIFGMVRGEDGEPIQQASVQIVLETTSGVQVVGLIAPNLEPGINYEMAVPMDAGITADPYIPNALTTRTPFLISVVSGSATFLPIEMAGDLRNLGDPGGETRIDLTLGVDSDGDGLPDAWEQVVISQLGGGLTLTDIRPDGDNDHDGLSNFSEYVAGTYAFDSEDGFALVVTETRQDGVTLEFLAIRNRSYEIQRTTDFKTWTAVPFRVPAESDSLRQAYPATDVRVLRVDVPVSAPTDVKYFYRGMVK